MKYSQLIFMSNYSKYILLIIIATIISVYHLWYNFDAMFGIIDDHEIMKFIVDLKQKSFMDIYLSTEVGNWGNGARYRPVYYLFRLIESSIWGHNYHLWYIARFFIFYFFIFSTLMLLSKKFNLLYSLLFTIFIASSVYLGDIFTRLGPGETYAVFGLSLFILGFWYFMDDGDSFWHRKSIWLIFFGAIIAIGSKENFLFLSIFSFYILIFLHNKTSIFEKIIHILIICFTFFITFGIILGLANHGGKDIYGIDASLVSRIKYLNQFIYSFMDMKAYIPLVAYIVISIYTKITLNLTDKNFKYFLVFNVVFIVIELSQIIFYHGIPSLNRYSMPYILFFQIYIIGLLWYLREIAKVIVGKSYFKELIIIFMSIYIFYFGFASDSIRVKSQTNSIQTKVFSSKIQKLVNISQKNIKYPIVLESYRANDYEPIASVLRYINSYNIQNHKFLISHINIKIANQFALSLASEIEKWSINGLGRDQILPLSKLHIQNHQCISVSFKSRSSLGCAYHIRIDYD